MSRACLVLSEEKAFFFLIQDAKAGLQTHTQTECIAVADSQARLRATTLTLMLIRIIYSWD